MNPAWTSLLGTLCELGVLAVILWMFWLAIKPLCQTCWRALKRLRQRQRHERVARNRARCIAGGRRAV